MPIYESKRATVCKIPALALTPSPTLTGILDNLEGQIGVDPMKPTIVNIMQQSASSFILHLAKSELVTGFMAHCYTFRSHLLEMAQAKNTTTVIVERVRYGLLGDALKNHLTQFGEVKSK